MDHAGGKRGVRRDHRRDAETQRTNERRRGRNRRHSDTAGDGRAGNEKGGGRKRGDTPVRAGGHCALHGYIVPFTGRVCPSWVVAALRGSGCPPGHCVAAGHPAGAGCPSSWGVAAFMGSGCPSWAVCPPGQRLPSRVVAACRGSGCPPGYFSPTAPPTLKDGPHPGSSPTARAPGSPPRSLSGSGASLRAWMGAGGDPHPLPPLPIRKEGGAAPLQGFGLLRWWVALHA